jgi:hypothetical protein
MGVGGGKGSLRASSREIRERTGKSPHAEGAKENAKVAEE